MKSILRKLLFVLLPLTFIFYIVSCNLKRSSVVVLDIAAKPFEKLSDYNFFSGVMNELKPNDRVLPYDLITPLFTDYAHKARFVYMPEGKSADYDTSQVLQLPVGSCLIKNFYYPADFRKPESERRIIETRLLLHREKEWEALDYVWNDEQTEATLEIAGDIKEVAWTHYDGTKKEIEYLIPNKNQCKGCHWNNGVNIVPIGPKVRNLNSDYTYADGKENQLARWTKAGFLKNAPAPENAPRIADYLDSVHYSVDQRSRAYLEMNCGHCHNPEGPAYTSGLLLNIENQNVENLGICKSPVAAGKATDNRLYDIVPGKPNESILVFRMETNDPGTRMPEVGRSIMHVEGVELITRWVSEMKPDACKVD
ncbi:MAG: SO2930 family diheme c-type cytochrome [Bacteroidota bacterium]